MKDFIKPFPLGSLEKSSLKVSWYPSFAGSMISTTSEQIAVIICLVWCEIPYGNRTSWESSGVDIDKYVWCSSEAEDCYITDNHQKGSQNTDLKSLRILV